MGPAGPAGPGPDLTAVEHRLAAVESRLAALERSAITPGSCLEIKTAGPDSPDGVYAIDPDGFGAFNVYCDMTTDGGGWIVFQRRMDGSVDFFRGRAAYQAGFGNLTSEFWLGNDKLARITADNARKLRVDLRRFSGQSGHASYAVFKVNTVEDEYRLTVSGFTDGGVGDGLSFHSGGRFSTRDADNDTSPDTHCAIAFVGAWWYRNCIASNLNGPYAATGAHHAYGAGIDWYTFAGFYEGMVFAEMKTR